MSEKFLLSSTDFQKQYAIKELEDCNKITLAFGLNLTKEQIYRLEKKRFEVLKDTGRIEFGDNIFKKIIYEFCDSPFVLQDEYETVLFDLLDTFYYFKNDTLDLVSDDELIKYMRVKFDLCEGDFDYLNGTSLEELSYYVKNGAKIDDRDGKLS